MNQGTERNKLDQRKLAEMEKGEVCQQPKKKKKKEIWGRQKHLKRIFKKLCSQICFVIFICWAPAKPSVKFLLFVNVFRTETGLLWELAAHNWSQSRC